MTFLSLYGAPIFWLAAVVILLFIESQTMGLTTIWFAGGAVAAFVAYFFHATFLAQVIIFIAVSIGLLVFTRPVFVNKMKTGKAKTNIDAIIGTTGVCTSEIDDNHYGRVKIGGMEWTAAAGEKDLKIEAGQEVIVKAIEGVKAIVVPAEKAEQ